MTEYESMIIIKLRMINEYHRDVFKRMQSRPSISIEYAILNRSENTQSRAVGTNAQHA